jgi:uncharacterized protein YjbJ (UPF0337 family)
MNQDIFEGKWKQTKGIMRQKWGDLTNDDLDYIQGSWDRAAGLLQERYGWARDRAERELGSLDDSGLG